jgi:hypothetical protein
MLVSGLVMAEPAHALQRSYIPLPEILTDPNEGNTYGALAVVLFLDEQKIIKYILAPDVRYNKITGVFPAFRLLGFPTLDKKWSIVLRKSQHIDEDYEFVYQDSAFWQDRLDYPPTSSTSAIRPSDSSASATARRRTSRHTAQEGVGVVRINYALQPTLGSPTNRGCASSA